MKSKFVLIQGNKRINVKRKRNEQIENISEDALRKHPFLQDFVKQANAHAYRNSISLADFLMLILQAETFLLAARNSLEIEDKGLREILLQSVCLSAEIREYIDEKG